VAHDLLVALNTLNTLNMEARMSSTTLTLGFVLGFVALAAVGCTTAQSTPSLTHAEAPRGCALGVPGSNVIAEDTAQGIALTFVSKDRAEEMRERANDAAAQHGPGQRVGRGHDGKHGHGGDHGLQMLQAPAAKAVAEDVEGGARVRFAAADPADKELLRTKLRDRANAMNEQGCK